MLAPGFGMPNRRYWPGSLPLAGTLLLAGGLLLIPRIGAEFMPGPRTPARHTH